jgi:hypothetical protein
VNDYIDGKYPSSSQYNNGVRDGAAKIVAKYNK